MGTSHSGPDRAREAPGAFLGKSLKSRLFPDLVLSQSCGRTPAGAGGGHGGWQVAGVSSEQLWVVRGAHSTPGWERAELGLSTFGVESSFW